MSGATDVSTYESYCTFRKEIIKTPWCFSCSSVVLLMNEVLYRTAEEPYRVLTVFIIYQNGAI